VKFEKGGLRRFAILLATATAAFLIIGVAQAAAQTGSLEVCKNSDNGMTGRSFSFTVTGPGGYNNVLPVTGGACSPVQSGLALGDYTVTEGTTTPPTDVSNIRATVNGSTSFGGVAVLRSRNLAGRTATVRVFDGQLTEVRFTNRAPVSQIKVCKISSDFDDGTLFSFTYTTGNSTSSPFSVPVNTNCSPLRTFSDNTVVTVTELIPANAFVAFIDVQGSCDTNGISEDTGQVGVVVHPGTCVVTFDDEATGPSQTGTIEICKDTVGSEPLPPGAEFTFVISSPGADDIEAGPITAPGCTLPITVAAGINTITENPTAGTQLDHVTCETSSIPSEDCEVEENTANRTETIDVPVGDTVEDIVTFFNRRALSQVKICKRLATNTGSSALANTFFHFTYSIPNPAFDPNQPPGPTNEPLIVVTTVDVRPGSCSLPFQRPAGETGTVTETVPEDVVVTSITPGPGSSVTGNPSTGTGTIDVLPGQVNEIDFTDMAVGHVEICKQAADTPTSTRSFTFRITPEVGPSKLITLKAAPPGDSPNCNPLEAGTVPAGRVTITELFRLSEGSLSDNSNFELAAVTVTPATARLTGTNDQPTNPTVVNVQFGQDVIVTFKDKVRTGMIKICKKVEFLPNSPHNGLVDDTFDIHWEYQLGATGVTDSGDVLLTPRNGVPTGDGHIIVCTIPAGLSAVPVVKDDGTTKTPVRMEERVPVCTPTGCTPGTTPVNPAGAISNVSHLPYFVCEITVTPASALEPGTMVTPNPRVNLGRVTVNPKAGTVVQVTYKNCIGPSPYAP